MQSTLSRNTYVYAQAFTTREGKRKVRLVNRRNWTIEVALTGINGGQINYVDQTSGTQPPATNKITEDKPARGSFAVAVLTLP